MFGFAEISEKNALGRILLISKEVYAGICGGKTEINIPAALDALSACLSHCNNEKEPASKLLNPLKRELKTKNKAFYPKVREYFKRGCFVPEFDYDYALVNIPAIIFGNDKICAKIVSGEIDKAKSMCDAMKSYPGYLFDEFGGLTADQFYDLVFGFYPKLYDEEFMEPMKHLFM